MNLTIEQAVLLKALNHVHNVIEARNTTPVLAHVLLSARENGLSLTATDLDIMIKETVPARIKEAGEALAPGSLLHNIIQKFDEGGEVTIALDDQRVKVHSGRSRFNLQQLPVDEFPSAIGEGELDHQFTLFAADLRKMIEATKFAMSNEETRYYLNGVYFHIPEEEDKAILCAVATDGHRLSRVRMKAPEGSGDMPGIIVPRKAILNLHKILEGVEGSVQIALSSSLIRFSLENITLTARLIEGNFPDYQRVIPDDNNKIMQVDSKEFSRAVARVSLIAAMRGQGVKMAADKDKLQLQASSADQGEASDEIEVSYQGEAIEVGYNGQYLLDITRDAIAKKAEFRWADAKSPTIICDCDDEQVLYVLMPMRV